MIEVLSSLGKFLLVVGAAAVALFVIYVGVRLATTAYFQSKSDYIKRSVENGEEVKEVKKG